jgi:hypothetical protein
MKATCLSEMDFGKRYVEARSIDDGWIENRMCVKYTGHACPRNADSVVDCD